MQQLLHVVPTVDNTVGALLLGIIAAAVLFGITCLQGFLYFHRYPRDAIWQKIAVATLWVLDVVHFSLAIHLVYTYAVRGFEDPSLLSKLIWSLKVQVAVNVVIILIVQSLYTYRVWLLGGYHRGFGHYIAILVLASGFALGIALAVKLAGLHHFDELDSINWAIDGSLAAATAIDLAISCAMCYYLLKSRSPSAELNTRIAKLIHFTLSSGVLISVTSTTCLICFVLLPGTLIFVALELLLTKIYVNSFFAMLNSRMPTTPHPSQYDSRGNSMGVLRPAPDPVRSIQYEVSVVRHRDEEEIGIALGGEEENKAQKGQNISWTERTAATNLNKHTPTYTIGW